MKNILKNDVIKGITAKKRTSDTEFLYATSYIRSIEEKGLCRELLQRMLDAPTSNDSEAILCEVFPEGNATAVCDEIVNEAYRTVDEVVSDRGLFAFMRYPYDANNIKTAIKCAVKGIPADGLLFGCGTLSADEYVKIAESGDFSALPAGLGAAAQTAFELYKKTGDPQSIDLLIDKECLHSMAEAARETGNGFIYDAVKYKIDISNILSVLRIVRMGGETVRSTLERTLADGGHISAESLICASVSENADEAERALITDVSPIFSDALSFERIGEIERGLEDAYLEFVYTARKVSFGCEVPFAYLVSSEYNAKNARIIIAGKRAGLDVDKIRERMRIYYV